MSCEMANDADGPSFCAYRQGYGLEMTFDDEWPFETIFLAPPYLLETIASDVDLESANAVSGASWHPGDCDLKRISNAKGKWVLSWPTEPIADILDEGLGSILYINNPHQLPDIQLPETANTSNMMIALQTNGLTTEANAKSLISKAKSQFSNTRVILSVGIDHNKNAPLLARLPDSDGTIFLNVFPGAVAQLVTEHLTPDA